MTECGCVYVEPDHYTWELSCTQPTARREHACSECGRAILPSEQYEKYVGTDDGDFFTHKTCLDCLSVRDEFFCGSFCWGAIWEYLHEHVQAISGQVSSECLLRLTPGAREGVIALIDKCFDEFDDDDEETDETE